MIKVNKVINLDQLDKEYNGEGLNASLDESGTVYQVGLADNNKGNEAELIEIIKNHNAQFLEPTLEEKLQSIGLSLADLKIALGLT